MLYKGGTLCRSSQSDHVRRDGIAMCGHDVLLEMQWAKEFVGWVVCACWVGRVCMLDELCVHVGWVVCACLVSCVLGGLCLVGRSCVLGGLCVCVWWIACVGWVVCVWVGHWVVCVGWVIGMCVLGRSLGGVCWVVCVRWVVGWCVFGGLLGGCWVGWVVCVG